MASFELTVQQVKKRVINLLIYLQSNGQNESRLIEHAVTYRSKRGRSSSFKSIVNSNRDRRTTTVFFFSFLLFFCQCIESIIDTLLSSMTLIVSSKTNKSIFFLFFFSFVPLTKYDTKKKLHLLVKISHWSMLYYNIVSNRLVYWIQWLVRSFFFSCCLLYLISLKALWICNWHFCVYSLDERID